MEITLEKIELVKDRTGVSYKEAKEALEAAEGSVVDAIIAIEETVNIKPGNKASDFADETVSKLKELVKKGNVTKISVKKDEETIVNIPLNVGIVGTIVAPWGVIAAAVAAFGFKCKIELTKDDGTPQAKEYIDAIYEKVIAGKGENFVQLAKNYSIGEVEDTPHMFDLNSVHKSFLDRFEALKLNEISKPYQESGQWRILYRVPVPKASYKGQQWRIRIRLEKERLGDAWSSLHEESGLKLNFAVPDIGM